ncbi:TIGR04053 family radical SAM/SPASM domain-containing protein [Candidatus Methylomirabilis sp.]|uniref:TIGR04053 family radical SAM/SPASM domain-containing protein n=1 Tax=Candidatus Methylomirabilis sp. TaxID=2032687 RepID=UPI003C766A63
MYPVITAFDHLVFAEAPKLIYWELTRACDLACKHCRAEAIAERDPWELSTEEAKALLAELRAFGDPPPQLVMTGGDPLKRPDFFELIRHGRSVGLPISVAPSGTPLLTSDAISALADNGVVSMSLSIDGSTAESHDKFRGVVGCFDTTMRAIHAVRAAAIPLQINTLVTPETMTELPGVFRLLQNLGIMRWSLFYLIATGRGRALREIRPSEAEALHHWLYDILKTAPFQIKATEAPHFRRVAYMRMRLEGLDDAAIRQTSIGRGFGIRDGNGIMFISHTGDVYPSGFLPEVAGNVRRQSPVALYRHSEIFTRIRDVDQYIGKCGLCEFRQICGGSRARAFAETDDAMGSDPLCAYRPEAALVGATEGD